MLIISLVLAVIGLAALVFAVVTSSAVVAWGCVVASVLGVILLIIDALRERRQREIGSAEAEQPDIPETGAEIDQDFDADYPIDPFDSDGSLSSEPESESSVDHDAEPAVQPDEYESDEVVSDKHTR